MSLFISIIAFGNVQDTIDQIENLYDKNNFYYVHWNKRDKYKKNLKILNDYFRNKKNIVFYTKFRVYWGHISILNTTIHASNYFLKRGREKWFINLDNKTIALKDIKSIEKFIESNKDKNFFGFIRKHYNYVSNKERIYWELQRKSYIEEESWKRKFYFKLHYRNSSKYLRFLLSILKPHIFIIFIWNIFSKLNIIEAYKKSFFHSIFFNGFDANAWSQKKLNTNSINKKLDLIFMNQIGPFLCIERDDIKRINNSLQFKELRKICKKIFAPEEFFYPTLYYNLINKNNDNSIVIFLNVDWRNSVLNHHKINNDILFLRRVIGKEEIQEVKNILKMCDKK